MTEERPRYIPAPAPTERSEEQISSVRGLNWIGTGLALVLAILGLIRVAEARPVSCASESVYACASHPLAFEGSVMIIVALLLGILVYVSCAILRHLLENARSAPRP